MAGWVLKLMVRCASQSLHSAVTAGRAPAPRPDRIAPAARAARRVACATLLSSCPTAPHRPGWTPSGAVPAPRRARCAPGWLVSRPAPSPASPSAETVAHRPRTPAAPCRPPIPCKSGPCSQLGHRPLAQLILGLAQRCGCVSAALWRAGHTAYGGQVRSGAWSC